MTDSHASQSTEPTIPAAAPPVDQVGRQPNTMLGVLAAIGFGLVAAGVYAVVAVITDREIGYLAVLIGVAVGWGFTIVGKVKNLALGFVAAVIAAIMFVVALGFAAAGFISGEPGETFFTGLDFVTREIALLLQIYFDEGFLAYVFLLLAVAPAFVIASGIRDKEE
ncbi:MAG: hypothetical protein CVT64_09180 [Actinobacteria bacterium HGW-Actinobacteria-4]|nr:MAG: hypothetical protein CVT64_09180 [Actinobacteria bacterium HGW-Actinobacteria-4]